jgi:hypothetical protein
VTDIHATILKQLGLDLRRLEIPGASGSTSTTARPLTRSLRESKTIEAGMVGLESLALAISTGQVVVIQQWLDRQATRSSRSLAPRDAGMFRPWE